MKNVGAAKVMTTTGPVWCHYSKQDGTLKIRRYSDGEIFERTVENDGHEEIEEFKSLKECMKLVSAKSYSYKNIEAWSQILQILQNAKATPTKEAGMPAPKKTIIVPITKLRQFYEVMKVLDTVTWINMAKFYSQFPASLERLWNQSREIFAAYHNMDGWGGDEGNRKMLPNVPARIGAISSTNEFAAFVKEPDNSLTNAGFTFVKRELNPRTTRKGMFSDKRPAKESGSGGIDILLRSSATGFPTVGEVKVKKDKNAFFALVQAMTYAVELSTPNQLVRLKKHFGDDFGNLNLDEGKVEIALLMVNPVKDDSREPILELIKKLNKRKKCQGLEKIVLLENKGEEWQSHS
jgi:hypothetical protein